MTFALMAIAVIGSFFVARALHAWLPFTLGGAVVLGLNMSNSPWYFFYPTVLVFLVLSAVSWNNQRKVPEGATKTNAIRHFEKVADGTALAAFIIALVYAFVNYLPEIIAFLWRHKTPHVEVPSIPWLLAIIAGVVVLAAIVGGVKVWRSRRRPATTRPHAVP